MPYSRRRKQLLDLQETKRLRRLQQEIDEIQSIDSDVSSEEIDDDPDDCVVSADCVVDATYNQPQFDFHSCTSSSVSSVLCYSPDAVPGCRAPVYTGNSYRSWKRENKERRELAQSAVGSQDIRSLFPVVATSNSIDSLHSIFDDSDELEETAEEMILPPDAALILLQHMEELQRPCQEEKYSANNAAEKPCSNRTAIRSNANFEVMRAVAVRGYLMKMQTERQPFLKIQTSEFVAETVFGCQGQSTVYRGKMIRFWAKFFSENGCFPERTHGVHMKIHPRILDEDIRDGCLTYLRSLTRKERLKLSGETFAQWVNHNVPGVHVSCGTARRWMEYLGFHFEGKSGVVYADGHERPDVVEYRQTQFLPNMMNWMKRMRMWRRDIELPPENSEEKEIVLVVHDESSFAANDAKTKVWRENGRFRMAQKGDGHVIMVSQFLCPCHGPLQIETWVGDEVVKESAVSIIKPGKDGYWTNADLIKQIQTKAIPIFNELHPGKLGLWLFDNSNNHRAMAADALRVSHLNLSDGSKKISKEKSAAILKDGWYMDADGNRIIQSMINEDGEQKGIRTILMERGLWRPGMKLDEARKLLTEQPDFKEQKEDCWLWETIHPTGHMMTFIPKFHPEFNFIERYWGQCKMYTRAHCDYSFKELEFVVPIALDSVSLRTIRRLYRHSLMYMKAYSDGTLQPHQVEWAMRKYSSHRRLRARDPNLEEKRDNEFLTPTFMIGVPEREIIDVE